MAETAIAGVSFDLFDTLLRVEKPEKPAQAVARALRTREIAVPADWEQLYHQPHIELSEGRELSLVEHVSAALASDSTDASEDSIEAAVLEAFDAAVNTRAGAPEALERLSVRGPVGVLSNCSVPGLVPHTLEASRLQLDQFDAIVSSVDCGWRKPDPRAFERVASELEIDPDQLVHVGDDPETDGNACVVGAEAVLLEGKQLTAVAETIEQRWV